MAIISRSKTIFVPITKVGRNYFPYIKELQDKKIKFIDIVSSYYTFLYSQQNVTTVDNSYYITLIDKQGNLFYDNIDIANFRPQYRLGQRNTIERYITLQNCFIEAPVLDSPKVVAVTFYWDEGEVRNAATKTYKETVELLFDSTPETNKSVKIKFPDIRTIAGKRIRSIRLDTMFGSSISPSGYPIWSAGWNTADPTSKYSIYLTLINGTNILIDQIDTLLLTDLLSVDPIEFNDILINFPDSYITFEAKYGPNNAVPTGVRSIPLIIEYLED